MEASSQNLAWKKHDPATLEAILKMDRCVFREGPHTCQIACACRGRRPHIQTKLNVGLQIREVGPSFRSLSRDKNYNRGATELGTFCKVELPRSGLLRGRLGMCPILKESAES